MEEKERPWKHFMKQMTQMRPRAVKLLNECLNFHQGSIEL